MANIDNSFEFVISFFRVSPQNEVLKNEKFELRSVDNKSIGLDLKTYDNGRQGFSLYVHDQSNYHYEELMPDFMLNTIKSFRTMQEATDYFNSNSYFYTWGSSTSLTARFTLPVVVHQLSVEPGFYARDFIFAMDVRLYVYADSTGAITKITFYYASYEAPTAYIYDKTVRQFRTLDDLKLTYTDFATACLDTTEGGMIITDVDADQCQDFESAPSTEYSLVPYFVAERGNITFKIDSTVNGVSKYNASNDKRLEYKVSVKNNGDVTSSNNIITSYVPEEVVVEENTISNSGTYNSQDHSVSWVVDYMNPNDAVEFSFNAIAPDSNDEKELVGYSSVKSKQVTEGVVSNNTIVSLDKIVEATEQPLSPDNPETSIPAYASNSAIISGINFLFSFIIVIFLVVLLNGKRKIKKDTD